MNAMQIFKSKSLPHSKRTPSQRNQSVNARGRIAISFGDHMNTHFVNKMPRSLMQRRVAHALGFEGFLATLIAHQALGHVSAHDMINAEGILHASSAHLTYFLH
jgi:hypothetical protein